MLIPLSRPLVAALSMLVLVSGSGAAAASTRPAVTPTLRAVPGSALPALRGAARVAPTAAARPIDVTVSLKPRNASLLAYSARTSSGSKPMTTAELRSLFAPSPADRAAVVAYMRGHGLHLERSGLLTLGFHGSAAAASRAFHVSLSTYRGADGHLFRAPDAAVRLPAAISPLVSSVTGLDNATKLHSLATGPELTPHTAVPTPSCTGRDPCQEPLRRLPARRPGHRVRPPLPDPGRQRRHRRVDRAGRVLQLQGLRHHIVQVLLRADHARCTPTTSTAAATR